MLVDEIVRAVKRQVGDETGSLVETEDVFRWINEGQFQIARKTADSTTIAPAIPVVVGDNRYSLPIDFFKPLHLEMDGRRLQLLAEAQLRTMYPTLDVNSQQGVPKFFAIVDNGGASASELILAPVPGSAGSLTLTYLRRPPLIRQTSDLLSIPDQYHNTLLTFCIGKARQMEGDDESWAAHTAQFKQEVTEDAHDARNKDDETYPFIRASDGDYYGGYV